MSNIPSISPYHPNKRIAIAAAIAHNFSQIKQYVLSGGDINLLNEEGHSLLTCFVRSDLPEYTPEEDEEFDKHPEEDYDFRHSFVPQYLLTPLAQRQDPLYEEMSFQDELDFFFAHGADPNLCRMVNGMTETPLMWAVVNQDYYLTKYLLEHGADPAVQLFADSIIAADNKEYWLMDHLDIYIMDGDMGNLAQLDLAIAQLLWEYGLKNWNGYCIDIDAEKGVTGGHSMKVLF